jgi:hypothetical protein
MDTYMHAYAHRTGSQQALRDELKKTLEPRGILIEDVLLKAVKLPSQLTHSIEQKAQAEQEVGDSLVSALYILQALPAIFLLAAILLLRMFDAHCATVFS